MVRLTVNLDFDVAASVKIPIPYLLEFRICSTYYEVWGISGANNFISAKRAPYLEHICKTQADMQTRLLLICIDRVSQRGQSDIE